MPPAPAGQVVSKLPDEFILAGSVMWKIWQLYHMMYSVGLGAILCPVLFTQGGNVDQKN